MFKNKVDTYLGRADYTKIKNVGLSVSQWLPFPLAIWAFALDGNIVIFFLLLVPGMPRVLSGQLGGSY